MKKQKRKVEVYCLTHKEDEDDNERKRNKERRAGQRFKQQKRIQMKYASQKEKYVDIQCINIKTKKSVKGKV